MRLKVDVETYIPIFPNILLKEEKSNTLNLHERTFTSFNILFLSRKKQKMYN